MESPADRVRAAIFIDFDNVFGGLFELEEEAAMTFARTPTVWLDRLARRGLPADARRDFLVRRCFLNPQGSLYSERYGNDRRRLYFSGFRSFFTRAGFDVVDCPPLTSRNKNAADIRIALDIVDTMQHETRFEEFVLLSGDADFTPVLQRLREHDRRTVVVSSNQTAKAYEAMVELFLDEQDLIGLVDEDRGAEADRVTPPPTVDPPSAETEQSHAQAIEVALEIIDGAERPVLLTEIASLLRERLGAVVDATGWFGRGSLSATLHDGRTNHLSRSQHHIWDPARHAAPPERVESVLPESLRPVATVTGMPRLSTAAYGAACAALAAWASEHPFNLTAITRDVRDRLHEQGFDVGRQPLAFVVRGCMNAGLSLDSAPAPDADAIVAAFATAVEQSAHSAQLELTTEESRLLREWIAGRG